MANISAPHDTFGTVSSIIPSVGPWSWETVTLTVTDEPGPVASLHADMANATMANATTTAAFAIARGVVLARRRRWNILWMRVGIAGEHAPTSRPAARGDALSVARG